jgi:prepilin-type N-terminal cleavage/methylation domain-containing protein
MNKVKQGANRGFTIVELLIVIVVIGILAAITIVAYTGITSQASKNTANSNAKAILDSANTYAGAISTYPPITGSTLDLSAAAAAPYNLTINLPNTVTVKAPIASWSGAGDSTTTVYYVRTADTKGICLGYRIAGTNYGTSASPVPNGAGLGGTATTGLSAFDNAAATCS